MKVSTILFGTLMAIAGVLIYFEAQPEPQRRPAKPKKKSEPSPALAPSAPSPEPVVQVPKSTATTAAALPFVAEPMESPPSPFEWYTARRVSVMSDTGVTSVPAGVEVSRLNDTEILYENKKFKVKPGDLTNDPLVAAEILAKTDTAELAHQQERENLAQVEQANVALIQTYEHEKKIARREQINSAISAVDKQILALQRKINYERNAEAVASANGKISSRGAVISRCEQAIAKLQTERMRLITMD